MARLRHAPNMRPVYGRPWRSHGLAHLGNLPTCVDVAVRPGTRVRTLGTMSRAFPRLPQHEEVGLVEAGSIYSTAMPAALASHWTKDGRSRHGLPPVADLRAVVHPDPVDPSRRRPGRWPYRFRGHVPNAAPSFCWKAAGAWVSRSGCRWRQDDDTGQGSGRACRATSPPLNILPVHLVAKFFCPTSTPSTGAECQSLAIFRFNDQIETPRPLPKDPFGFPLASGGTDALWVLAHMQGEADASIDRGE